MDDTLNIEYHWRKCVVHKGDVFTPLPMSQEEADACDTALGFPPSRVTVRPVREVGGE